MEMEREEYKGYTISIEHDNDPENPRDFCDYSTFALFHKRYSLGDPVSRHGIRTDDYSGWADMEAGIMRKHPKCVILPVYLYDHSGLTMSTTPFHCPWDSGQVGYAFVPRDKACEWLGKKYLTKKGRAVVEKWLVNEVRISSLYCNGEVYGFSISKDEEELDSCWGFYGMEDAIQSAREAVDNFGQ